MHFKISHSPMGKKLLVIIMLLISCQAFAQYQGQSRLMQSYDIASSSRYFGVTIGGEYFPIHNLSFAPSITFFIPPTGNARGFDLNMRYYVTEESFQFYGLLGYGNYVRATESNPSIKTAFNSANLGIGALIKLREEIGINPEIRYQAGDRNEFIFRLGIVYFIN
jgi:hypothetical protein